MSQWKPSPLSPSEVMKELYLAIDRLVYARRHSLISRRSGPKLKSSILNRSANTELRALRYLSFLSAAWMGSVPMGVSGSNVALWSEASCKAQPHLRESTSLAWKSALEVLVKSRCRLVRLHGLLGVPKRRRRRWGIMALICSVPSTSYHDTPAPLGVLGHIVPCSSPHAGYVLRLLLWSRFRVGFHTPQKNNPSFLTSFLPPTDACRRDELPGCYEIPFFYLY